MYKNETGISFPLAVMLAHDDYDHSDDPLTISATTLLKSTRSIVLGLRSTEEADIDIHTLIPSSLGTAVHAQLEKVWTKGLYKAAMLKLGYPKKITDAIMVNPKGEVPETAIPIYLEQRVEKKLGKWTITGMYDLVLENTVMDLKTTKAYSYIMSTNDEKYSLQGSIYRWLNPDIITEDTMSIEYLFTDWNRMQAKTSKDYPPAQILSKKLPLHSLADIEAFITHKLNDIEQYMHNIEKPLPLCTPKELWQRDTVWKYYKDPNKRTRSTKNFTNALEANSRLMTDGNIGVVIEVPGEVVACQYCASNTSCTQAEQLILDGLLKL